GQLRDDLLSRRHRADMHTPAARHPLVAPLRPAPERLRADAELPGRLVLGATARLRLLGRLDGVAAGLLLAHSRPRLSRRARAQALTPARSDKRLACWLRPGVQHQANKRAACGYGRRFVGRLFWCAAPPRMEAISSRARLSVSSRSSSRMRCWSCLICSS